MTAQLPYITSTVLFFSTFLEKRVVPEHHRTTAIELLSLFLETRDSDAQIRRSELQKFMESHKAEPECHALLQAFILQYNPSQARVFFHEFIENLKREKKSLSTIKNYYSDISQYISQSKAVTLNQLFSPEKLMDFVAQQQEQQLKTNSIKRKMSSLSQLASWAEQHKLVQGAVKQVLQATELLEKKQTIHEINWYETQVEEFLQDQKTQGLTESTLKNYKSDLSQLLAHVEQSNRVSEPLSFLTLKNFIGEQKKANLKENSIKRKLATIAVFYSWLSRQKQGSVIQKKEPNWELLQAITSAQPPTTTQESVNSISAPSKWPLLIPTLFGKKTTALPDRTHGSTEVLYPLLAKLTSKNQQQSSKVTSALHGFITLLLILGLSFLGYQQFAAQAPSILAYPTAPVRPNRELSFQGRLTDTAQNPVTTPADMEFRLYDVITGGTELWNSGTCAVTPDQDGIFNVGLGDTCGAEISEDVFSENSSIWLEVEVETEILTPRQSIKTVPYALNSETVQGYPVSATGAATINTILTMDSGGQILLAETAPSLKVVSGSFSIEAQALTLNTSAGSNGDIILNPDGTGITEVLSDLTSTGYITAPGATLSATYAGGTVLSLNAVSGATANILEWTNTSNSGAIDANGNIGIGTTSPTFNLDVGGDAAIGTDLNVGQDLYLTRAIYANSDAGTSGYLLTSSAGGAMTWTDPASLAVSPEWSSLLDPTTNLSLNMGTNTTVSNWTTGTSTNNLFSLTTAPSANGTGSLLNIQTGVGASVIPLRVRAGSTEGLIVDAAGNVGIGTTAASGKLTVKSAGANTPGLSLIESSGTDTLIDLRQSSASEGELNINDTTGTTAISLFSTGGDGNINLYDSGVLRILLRASGGVGDSYFNTGGNIGIGTNTPSYTLDVTGELNLTDAIRVAGDAGTSGYLLTSSAGGAMTWTDPGSLGGGSPAWNSITDPSGNQSLAMAANTTTWTWNGLTTGTGLTASTNSLSSGSLASLAVTGTAAASNTQTVLNLSTSGANATATQTTYGLYSTNTHTGTGAVNVAGYFSASGGTSNYAGIFAAGNVGIGAATPSQLLDVAGEIELANYLYFGNGSSEYLRWDASNFILSDDLLPASDGASNLGSDSVRWNSLYVKGSSLHIGDSGDEGIVGYNTTDNYLSFDANADATADMVVRATGRVGIGTTDPTGLFHTTGAVTGKALAIFNETGDQDILTASASGATRMRVANNGYVFAERFSDITNPSFFLDPAAVSTSLTTAGNIGIGTDTPTSIGEFIQTTGADLFLSNSSTTVTAEDILGSLSFKSYDSSTAGEKVKAYIRGVAESTFTGGNHLSKLEFGTAVGTALPTTQMVLTSAGNLGIGTTTANAPLEVQNTVNLGLRLKSTSSGYWDLFTVFNNTNSDLIFASTGVERMRIDTNGNIGVGTTTTSNTKLEIYSTATDAMIRIGGAATANPYIDFAQAGTQKAYLQYVDSGDYFRIVDNSTVGLVQRSGQVGINMTDPQGDLHVGDGTLSGVIIDNRITSITAKIAAQIAWAESGTYSAGDLLIAPRTSGSNGSLRVITGTTPTEKFTVLGSNGNVGIGIGAPAAKLDIEAGSINVDTTTNANQNGAILKDGNRFLHDFNYGNNGSVTTVGYNTFLGIGSGNFTMGSTATQVYHSSYNTGLGYQTLANNTVGYQNTAVGFGSMVLNTSGVTNTAIGYASLYNSVSGDSNTALGYTALYGNTTGYSNTGVGYAAGWYLTDGVTANQSSNNSIYLGLNTRALAASGTNEIVIGNSATGLGSNTVVLGNSSITTTALRGNVGIGTTAPAFKLDVDGTFQADTPIRKTDYWSTMSSMPASFNSGSSLVYTGNNYLFALVGGDDVGFYRYSISDDTWTAMTSVTGSVDSGGLVYTGGDYIYAMRANSTSSFYRYSISGDSWSTMSSLPATTSVGGSLEYAGGDYIYALRGDATTSFYRYSISGDSWSTMTAVTGSTTSGGDLVYTGGDYIYASRGGNQTSFYRYSISGDSWTTMSVFPATIGDGSSLAYTKGNYIYALRGNTQTALYRYSISTNEWTTMSSAPATIGSGSSLALDGNNNLYAIRGGGASTDFYRYAAGGDTFFSIENLGADLHGYNPQRDIVLVDEFVSGLLTTGNIGDLGWSLGAGTTLGVAPSSGATQVGILHLRTAATAGTRGNISLSSGAIANRIINTAGGVNTHISMTIANVAAANANLDQRIGLIDVNAAGEATNGLFFRATGTGNWFAVNRAAGVETATATDCSVAQSTSYKTFEILINAAASSIVFKIDGTVCATHTANIPASSVTLSPSFKIDTGDATIRGMYIDRFVLTQSPLIIGADLAEFYHTSDSSIGAGDIVATDPNQAEKVLKADTAVNPNMLGIVSTQPGKVLGNSEGDGLPVIVGLAGRVPVKVITTNGPINAGDYITISEIPGVGAKAVSPGQVVGMALEGYENEDPNAVGTVLVLIKNTWHDPVAANAEQERLAAVQSSLEGFELVASDGTILTKIAAFSQATIASLRAGLISTQELVVEKTASITNLSVETLTINGQTLSEYIASVVAGTSQELPLTSPLSASDSAVASASTSATSSLLSKLMVEDAVVVNNLTVGNTLLTQQLQAEIISASNIQVATIEADQATITSARIAQLETNMAQFESVRATTAELMTATISGTLYANNIYDFESKVAATLQQPSLLALLSGQANQENSNQTEQNLQNLYEELETTISNASSAAELNKSLADVSLTADQTTLGATAVFVDQYFKVNGAAYIADSLGIGNSLFVENSIKIGQSTYIADGSISYRSENSDLQVFRIQPEGTGSIELLAGILTINQSGEVSVSGELKVAGSITASTSLLTNLLKPTDFVNPLQVQVAGIDTTSQEVKRSRFEIIDEVGTPVATFSAQGRAEFAGGIGISSQSLGVPNENNEVSTDKTSGKATIKSGETEIKIRSAQINDNSLIYVTAVGSTGNQVLYVKGQVSENPETPDMEGMFSVGFDTLVTQDVAFNWWIVN